MPVSHLLNWEAKRSIKMVYQFGNWETCGVFLIHIDMPGYLFLCVWVLLPASPFSVRIVLFLKMTPSLSLAGSAAFSCT